MPPKGRILHVETHEDTRRLVSYVLTHAGYEVIPTQNAHEALGVASRIPFDLYLIATWLPVMSGIELCGRLRQSHPNIPILFVSGAASEVDKQRALDCGASGYLVKPLDMDDLVKEVRRLTSKDSRQCGHRSWFR